MQGGTEQDAQPDHIGLKRIDSFLANLKPIHSFSIHGFFNASEMKIENLNFDPRQFFLQKG
jgi:hypothetical protein